MRVGLHFVFLLLSVGPSFASETEGVRTVELCATRIAFLGRRGFLERNLLTRPGRILRAAAATLPASHDVLRFSLVQEEGALVLKEESTQVLVRPSRSNVSFLIPKQRGFTAVTADCELDVAAPSWTTTVTGKGNSSAKKALQDCFAKGVLPVLIAQQLQRLNEVLDERNRVLHEDFVQFAFLLNAFGDNFAGRTFLIDIETPEGTKTVPLHLQFGVLPQGSTYFEPSVGGSGFTAKQSAGPYYTSLIWSRVATEADAKTLLANLVHERWEHRRAYGANLYPLEGAFEGPDSIAPELAAMPGTETDYFFDLNVAIEPGTSIESFSSRHLRSLLKQLLKNRNLRVAP